MGKLCSGYSGMFQQVCMTYAVNTLAEREIVELPVVNRKTYTATEIGNIIGISANKIGKLANKYGLNMVSGIMTRAGTLTKK